MSKIYVVFYGEYSDKCPQCAFDNEKEAEMYIASVRNYGVYKDKYSIKELELNPCAFADDKIVYVYGVRAEEMKRNPHDNGIDVDGDKKYYRYLLDDYVEMTEKNARSQKCDNRRFCVILDKPDKEKAMKIARDKVAELRAMSEGIT